MAKAKKQDKSIEQRLKEALVLYEKTPYELPSNWCWVEFKNLCKVMNGYAFKSSKYVEQGTRIIRITNVQDGYVEDDKPVYYSQKDMEGLESFLLKENDILVSLTGNVGRVATIHRDMLPAALNQRVACLRPTFSMDNRYVYYYLLSDDFRKNCLGSAKGIAQQNMSTETIKEFAFPLAPLEEQKRIVEIIDKQFAKLDEARDLIQKSLDSFADRKSAILHKAFTGELTKNWRESNSRKESKQRISIEEVVEINPKNKKPICDDESEVSFVPMRAVCEIKGEVKEILFEKFKKVKKGFTYFEEDDVLFAKITPCMENGKCFVASGLKNGFGFASTEFYVFRCSNKINKKYLWYILRDKAFRNKAAQVMTGAVGQQRVPKSFLEKEKIYLYDIEEQEEIVRILDSIFEKEDKSKELIDMLDKIDEMKKSILARAFRGQLGTSNTTDEPATDLLRKILEQNT